MPSDFLHFEIDAKNSFQVHNLFQFEGSTDQILHIPAVGDHFVLNVPKTGPTVARVVSVNKGKIILDYKEDNSLSVPNVPSPEKLKRRQSHELIRNERRHLNHRVKRWMQTDQWRLAKIGCDCYLLICLLVVAYLSLGFSSYPYDQTEAVRQIVVKSVFQDRTL